MVETIVGLMVVALFLSLAGLTVRHRRRLVRWLDNSKENPRERSEHLKELRRCVEDDTEEIARIEADIAEEDLIKQE